MSGADLRNATIMDAMAFVVSDEILILCYSESNPSDREWDAWIAQINRRQHRATLISTKGGSPNARQRARMVRETDYGSAPRPPMALLTDSALLRSIMTAFGWLYGRAQPMKAFSRHQLGEAVPWLGVEVPPARVRAVLEALQAKLSKERTEQLVR